MQRVEVVAGDAAVIVGDDLLRVLARKLERDFFAHGGVREQEGSDDAGPCGAGFDLCREGAEFAPAGGRHCCAEASTAVGLDHISIIFLEREVCGIRDDVGYMSSEWFERTICINGGG